MMNKILQLLGILTFVICNYGNAKELKCEYELKNLNIEPVRVANAKRTYTVYISCKYTSVHHTGETGGPIPLRKTITPVVTGTDDEKRAKPSICRRRKHSHRNGPSAFDRRMRFAMRQL